MALDTLKCNRLTPLDLEGLMAISVPINTNHADVWNVY